MKRLIVKFTLLLTGLLASVQVTPQTVQYVRINEIQVHNTNGFKDEYGRAGSWIELHNKGYGKANIAGCTLKVKGIEYHIPKKDPATLIPTKGYVVFFAGGISDRGTFHTNFTLENTDFIEFYDADGKLVDAVHFNAADMIENVSYGWFDDGSGKEKWVPLPATTPGSGNNTVEKISRSEIFRNADPWGAILTLSCITVVAIVLTLLFFVFKYMGKFQVRIAKRKAARKKAKTTNIVQNKLDKMKNKKDERVVVTNDELAAIAIALYKYCEDLRDNEKSVHIINRASKANSPWCTKNTIRHFPNKKYRYELQNKSQRRGI